MKRYYADSDIGSVLIGNDGWTFAVPNGIGDGTSEILVFDDKKEFEEFKNESREIKRGSLRFVSSAQGTFNIYGYDCAFERPEEEEVLTTLTGRYGVYYVADTSTVIFVKWE